MDTEPSFGDSSTRLRLAIPTLSDEVERQTAELCSQCQSLNVEHFLPNRSSDKSFARLHLQKNTPCPCCFFFVSTLEKHCNRSSSTTGGCNIYPVTLIRKRVCGRSFHAAFIICSATLDIVFDVFLTHNNQAPQVENYDVRLSRQSYVDFDILKTWIDDCQNHHLQHCTRKDYERLDHPPGFRVIDCYTKEIIEVSTRCTYVALSYVWGAPTENESSSCPEPGCSRYDTLPLRLPRTVQDAVEVVVRLGYRYLWIDKYCIDQSDKSTLHEQLSSMDQIYKLAVVTIIVAAGDNASHGLPGISIAFQDPRLVLSSTSWYLTPSRQDPRKSFQHSTWSSRAWTYQEGLFSQRRLVFTEQQVFFECDTANFQEPIVQDDDAVDQQCDYNSYRPCSETMMLFNGAFRSYHQSFASHLQEYTKRKLSYQEDALNAVSGVFRAFTLLPTPIAQYWGIPLSYRAFLPNGHWSPHDNLPTNPMVAFCFGLLWRSCGPSHAKRRDGFPSWSWSGWNASVDWSGCTILSPRRRRRADIAVRDKDGVEVSEQSLIDAVKSLGSAPVLRITAKVLELRFVYLQEDVSIDCHHVSMEPRGSVFCAIRGDRPSRGAAWPLRLTPKISEGDPLWLALHKEAFSCIILHESVPYGLVVWGKDNVKERIGLIGLHGHGFRVEKSEDVEQYIVSPKLHKIPWSLRKHFPEERREILLS
ncbi:HET-domain-containing protein [Dothidotthia symphoricarpi CBS 119687]|uniref:HET-domain-containing protein n=1 Tax=Dothidotthia symphoricarpi CBS 119687 TaxID=1392245 RepID=A0A6A6ADA7_9PLEO|nr:HET-domain-containing protein [Dothidotthia symphoricarpi CBS 119687]KAF2129809.1 HET-domain-containing protein [Dothidotthia symphoricarpi CBS 119687]